MLRLNRETASMRICIDRAEFHHAWDFSGRVVSRRLRQPIVFSDVAGLLLQLDAIMDTQGYPQAFQQTRTFTRQKTLSVPAARDEAEMLSEEAVASAAGALITFTLHVFTRRKATWQGMVVWPGEPQGQTFDSALELLKLVSNRLF